MKAVFGLLSDDEKNIHLHFSEGKRLYCQTARLDEQAVHLGACLSSIVSLPATS